MARDETNRPPVETRSYVIRQMLREALRDVAVGAERARTEALRQNRTRPDEIERAIERDAVSREAEESIEQLARVLSGEAPEDEVRRMAEHYAARERGEV